MCTTPAIAETAPHTPSIIVPFPSAEPGGWERDAKYPHLYTPREKAKSLVQPPCVNQYCGSKRFLLAVILPSSAPAAVPLAATTLRSMAARPAGSR